MNHMSKYILLFSSLFVLLPSFTMAQDTLTFVDNFNDINVGSSIYVPIPTKKSILTKKSARIVTQMDNNVPDSIRTCIEVATTMWEAALQIPFSANYKFTFENLVSGNGIETSVAYSKAENGVYYPNTLYRNLNKLDVLEQSIEVIIKINNSKYWDCSFTNHSSDRNLTYAILRSIPIGLGFGTSLTYKNNAICFTGRTGHSPFDNIIFNENGDSLKNIANNSGRGSVEITAFAQPSTNSIFALRQSHEYKLYSPNPFEKYKSLIFLDNEYSLMHYNLSKGTKILAIDSITINLLKSIGWQNSTNQIEIVSEDLENECIGSAYLPHKFHILNKSRKTILNPQWKLFAQLKTGGDTILYESNSSLEFSIPKISNTQRLVTNINGDLRCIVYFEGEIENAKVQDHISIYLEQKPQIKVVSNLSKTSVDNLRYNAQFVVDYVGSDYVEITLEEEDATSFYSQQVKEPYRAYVNVTNITKTIPAWIYITVKNQYGTANYTIDLAPFEDTELVSYIEIYSFQTGEVIAKVNNEVELQQKLQTISAGIYIVTYYENGKRTTSRKLCKT